MGYMPLNHSQVNYVKLERVICLAELLTGYLHGDTYTYIWIMSVGIPVETPILLYIYICVYTYVYPQHKNI